MERADVIRSYQEFLVVALHVVAYRFDVYPANTFSLVRQYSTATRQNNHPGFRQWAEQAAASVAEVIGQLESHCAVSIVILENNVATQRIGMTLDPLESLEPKPAESEPESESRSADQPPVKIDPSVLEIQYRAAITFLQQMSLLRTGPSDKASQPPTQVASQASQHVNTVDRTMTIVFDSEASNMRASSQTEEDSPWLPVEPNLRLKGTIKPVRYVEAEGVFGLNVFYQQLK